MIRKALIPEIISITKSDYKENTAAHSSVLCGGVFLLVLEQDGRKRRKIRLSVRRQMRADTHDLVNFAACKKFARRRSKDDASILHQNDLIAVRERMRKIVQYEHKRLALCVERADEIKHFKLTAQIQDRKLATSTSIPR